MHKEKGPGPYEPDQSSRSGGNGSIGRHRAEPRLPAIEEETNWQPILQNEQVGWTDTEHDEWISVDPIAKTMPEGERQIFVHRKSIDVADPASFKATGVSMMEGVGATPKVIGRQRQHPDYSAYPIVCYALAKERAMTAIVLNHEESHEKTRCRYRKRQREPPIAEMQRCPSQYPERRKGHKCDCYLNRAAKAAGMAIARNDLRPPLCAGPQDRTIRSCDVQY